MRSQVKSLHKLVVTHPGEIPKGEFLDPMRITPHALSKAIHVTAPQVNDIVLEKRGITADLALRLSRFFETTPQFWSNLQAEYERRLAINSLPASELDTIIPASHEATGFAAGEKSASAHQAQEILRVRFSTKRSSGPKLKNHRPALAAKKVAFRAASAKSED